MKIKLLTGILMSLLILVCISSAAATYTGHESITVQKGESFELYLLRSERIDDKLYDHNMLRLVSMENDDPIYGCGSNVYKFKALNEGTTKISIIDQNIICGEVRTIDVYIH